MSAKKGMQDLVATYAQTTTTAILKCPAAGVSPATVATTSTYLGPVIVTPGLVSVCSACSIQQEAIVRGASQGILEMPSISSVVFVHATFWERT